MSGDTRLINKYVYGAQTVYNNTSEDLKVMANKVFQFAVGPTHSYVDISSQFLVFLSYRLNMNHKTVPSHARFTIT